jgi:dihydroneopterin aldolase
MDDIALAFAHPEDRAAATAGPGLRDRISLRDHVVEAEIGAFQQERGRTQRLRVNIVVEVALPGDVGDDVDRILSYDLLVEAVAAELAAERLNLLETLAVRVAERILGAAQAMRAFVRIEKLDLGPFALGVEIVRSRAEVPVRGAAGAVHPLVVLLDNATLAAADLPERLTRWEAEAPVVLCLCPPDLPLPVTGHGPTQRRVDLLAIEQNAWVLAARDPRCVVVAARTEIDRAMKQGRTVVWAPSKMVLDAVDGPSSRSPGALALWLAEALAARRLLVGAGLTMPAGSRVPVAPL